MLDLVGRDDDDAVELQPLGLQPGEDREPGLVAALALGPAVAARKGELFVPVYLGDAMQLQTTQMMSGKELVIVVPDPPGEAHADNGMVGRRRTEMKFPDILCKELRLFDKLVARMKEGYRVLGVADSYCRMALDEPTHAEREAVARVVAAYA